MGRVTHTKDRRDTRDFGKRFSRKQIYRKFEFDCFRQLVCKLLFCRDIY